MIIKRTKAGLKRGFKPLGLLGGAALGAAGGGFLGSRKSNKAGNIGSIIGAGVGALSAAAVGYRKGVKEWDYNNDPEILKKREEEGRKEIRETINNLLLDYKSYLDSQKNIRYSKELEKKYNFKFKPDWYKFIQVSANFFRKNLTTWFKVIENCNYPFDFSYLLSVENSTCDLLNLVPSPGYMGIEEEENNLLVEDLLSFDSNPDYFVDFLPEEDKYRWYLKKYDSLAEIFKEIDLVGYFKGCSNNGQKEPYKDNPDIYNTHLKIIEEYARLLKQIR